MNLSLFKLTSTSVSAQPSLPVASSTLTQEAIQPGTTAKELTRPSIKSAANSGLDVYSSNVLNLPMSLSDERENSRLEVVQTRNQIARKNRLYW